MQLRHSIQLVPDVFWEDHRGLHRNRLTAADCPTGMGVVAERPPAMLDRGRLRMDSDHRTCRRSAGVVRGRDEKGVCVRSFWKLRVVRSAHVRSNVAQHGGACHRRVSSFE
jgi:hypothetical protein